MWTKTAFGRGTTYRSFFMLVRIRSGPVRLVIPLPLFVIAQTLEAIQDLLWVTERLIPHLKERVSHQNGRSGRIPPGLIPSEAIRLCREVIEEMRRYGKWRLVEVATGKGGRDTRVYVDFF